MSEITADQAALLSLFTGVAHNDPDTMEGISRVFITFRDMEDEQLQSVGVALKLMAEPFYIRMKEIYEPEAEESTEAQED